jgi:hypothetical protein
MQFMKKQLTQVIIDYHKNEILSQTLNSAQTSLARLKHEMHIPGKQGHSGQGIAIIIIWTMD